MLDTAIPSIFNGVESIPNTETFKVIDNEQEPTAIQCTKERIETSINVGIDENVTDDVAAPIDNFFNVNNQFSNTVLLKFLVINDAEVQIQSKNELHIMKVPKPWTIGSSFTENNCKLIFLQVTTRKNNDETPVIKKSIVIDNKRLIKYYVHGQLVKQHKQNLLHILKDLETLANNH